MRRIDSRLRALGRDGIVVAGISLLLLLILESGVRIIYPQDSRTTYVSGVSAAVLDEVLGYVYRPGAHILHSGPEFTVEYEINDDGMRDSTPHPRPKPPGLFRVLLLGDSFAMGRANDYEAMFPVVFERELQALYDVDVVKAGVSGYDTRTELLYLERLMPEYNPDLVVLVFLPNDLFTNRAITEGHARTLPSRKTPDVAVLAREDKATELHLVTLAKRALMSSDWLYMKLYARSARAEYFTVRLNTHVARQVEITKELLLKARDTCRKLGVRFAVLSIPQQFQVVASAGEFATGNMEPDHVEGIFRGFALENDIHWISAMESLAHVYRKNGADLYHRFDGHLTREGNLVVAEHLLREFKVRFRTLLESAETIDRADPTSEVDLSAHVNATPR